MDEELLFMLDMSEIEKSDPRPKVGPNEEDAKMALPELVMLNRRASVTVLNPGVFLLRLKMKAEVSVLKQPQLAHD